MEKDDKLIIMVDDDKDDKEFFAFALGGLGAGYKFIGLDDGPGFISYLANESSKLPRMVFLDINMPRMRGFECLAFIRQKYNKKELPVAIYTTSSHELDKYEARINGANLYILKPVDINPLRSLIRKALSYTWDEVENHEMVMLWKEE